MTQIAVRNPDGMATSFQSTQLVNLGSTFGVPTVNSRMTQVFQKIKVGSLYEKQPLALYQTKMSKNRQLNILKALMVSPTYWEDLIGAVGLAVTKQLNIYNLTSEFVSTGGRFLRLISRLTPRQDRYENTYEIQNVGGVGQIDLGFAFASLDILGATPTNTFPATGLVEFDVGDVGKLVTVAYVTVPVFNVMKIIRTHEQPDGEYTGHEHPAYAYVMHPTLAPTLSIPVPVV
jgi:hypothetical protein